MNYEILHEGTFPMVKCHLEHGEQIKAESNAMITMSPTIDVTGNTEGGIFKGIARMAAGEKFFFQHLSANRGAGDIIFAHSLPGDIVPITLNGTGLKIQKDGFLASTIDVDLETKVQNLTKGLFSGEGFFVLGARGQGTVFVSSYGAIHEINLNSNEEIISLALSDADFIAVELDACSDVLASRIAPYTKDSAYCGKTTSNIASSEGSVSYSIL